MINIGEIVAQPVIGGEESRRLKPDPNQHP
jgi:hypothetical protein